MLGFLGLDDLDGLFAEVPYGLRLAGGLDLPAAMSEPDVAWRLDELASRNRPVRIVSWSASRVQVPTTTRSRPSSRPSRLARSS